jgi:predicted transposase/invertase (TIGR01784 family)
MNKTKENKISNAHDQFFRTAMADKRVAHDFLTAWLPGELCLCIDFDQLEIQPRSHINDVRQESAVDVLFKTMIEGHEAYIYLLLEHQSTPDPLMPFRMLKYMCNIIDHHLKALGGKKIPLIYPLVIYHGKRKYPFSTNLNDLVDAPPSLIDRYFLKPFQLIDLGQIDDGVCIEAHFCPRRLAFFKGYCRYFTSA